MFASKIPAEATVDEKWYSEKGFALGNRIKKP